MNGIFPEERGILVQRNPLSTWCGLGAEQVDDMNPLWVKFR